MELLLLFIIGFLISAALFIMILVQGSTVRNLEKRLGNIEKLYRVRKEPCGTRTGRTLRNPPYKTLLKEDK